jgi:hypothetical protein
VDTSVGDAADAADAAELLAARAEADRLRAEVVRLHARVQVLEEALALSHPAPVAPRLRGLASLINSDNRQAQEA